MNLVAAAFDGMDWGSYDFVDMNEQNGQKQQGGRKKWGGYARTSDIKDQCLILHALKK